jgi:hypothetical protein
MDPVRKSRVTRDERVGHRYGRLTVVALGTRSPMVRVQCDCGVEKEVSTSTLSRGMVSCGCYRGEQTADRNRANITHGMSYSREYRTWQSMLSRCYNPKATKYPSYGAVGITVCSAWRDDFAAFLADMGVRPEGTTLDRVDSARGYEPGNCRWATATEQNRNRKNVTKHDWFGRSLPLSVIADEVGVGLHLLHSRLKRGWDLTRSAFTVSKQVAC